MTSKTLVRSKLFHALLGACAMFAASSAFAQYAPPVPPADPQTQVPPPPPPPPVPPTDMPPPPPAPPGEPLPPEAPQPGAPMPPPTPAAPIPPGGTMPSATGPVSVQSQAPNSISSNYRVDFATLDGNGDGNVSRAEVRASGNDDLMREFHVVDANHNGRLTKEEMKGWLD